MDVSLRVGIVDPRDLGDKFNDPSSRPTPREIHANEAGSALTAGHRFPGLSR